MTLISALHGTEIYLIDQLLKGRIASGNKILDAGCGSGRNMRWLANEGFHIEGCDSNAETLLKAQAATGLSAESFRLCKLEKMPYPNAAFDGIICNAVLHFAQSTAHFNEMMNESYRVLRPGGWLFIRTASDFGLPANYVSLSNGRFRLADGTDRFLLNASLLEEIKQKFKLLDPVKSTLVDELRSMTTLMLQK